MDLIAVALEVGAALNQLEIPFHLGGSLASSIHGIPRATLDADLVAAMKPGQGEALATRLADEFYADIGAMETAIRDKRCFNVIHLKTMFKVDVFILEDTPFARESFHRSRPELLGEPAAPISVATPEDTVLHKLLWYLKGDEVSARQWGDLLGVLKVQRNTIDGVYLDRWARTLGLNELLSRAQREAFGDGPCD